MITKNDIVQVLQNLAVTRPAFCSEADFQLSFAWELKKFLSVQSIPYEIFLERKFIISSKECYVDVCVESQDELCLIELKYKTVKEQVSVSSKTGTVCTLKNQAANDLGRYGYLKDIWRIENALSHIAHKKSKNGFAIILTNDKQYYENPQKVLTTVDQTFRIHERTDLLNPFNNFINWTLKGTTAKWMKSYPSFRIVHTPSFCWNKYSVPAKQEFRYLITEI